MEIKELEKYYPFALNEEQKNLLRELIDFLQSDDEIFILKGFAGTGKTSIMLGLVKYMEEKKIPFSLMASTGRAAKVLAQKSGHPAATLHSSIYVMHITEIPKSQRKDEDMTYRIGFKLKNPNTVEDKVYFVDESSMISNSFQKGQEFTFGTGYLMDDFFKYKHNGKIVFIGDPAQLPPVNQKFSAALDKRYLLRNYGIGVREFALEKVMRYKTDSGMYYNTTHLREIINSKRFPPLAIKTEGFNDMEVYKHENDLIKKYYEIIKTQGVDNAIYITYTNKTTAFVNKKVRIHLWGLNKEKELQVNESLIVARNNYLYGLSNGDLITVDSIDDKVIKKAGLSFRKIVVRVADDDPGRGFVLKEVMIINDVLYAEGRDLSFEQDMNLIKNFFIRMRYAATEIYDYVMNNQTLEKEELILGIEKIAHLKEIDVDATSIAEKPPSKKKLIKDIAWRNIQTDPYLNALRVKYGYAITCHKAQGSEWPHVFIHFEKSLDYMDKENLYRWVYTAISRAENKLHLLDSKYIY